MARLSVTVDDDLKRDFLAAAREYGSSGAALVRADLEHPAPARTPAAALQLVRRITLDMLTAPASQ